MKAPKTRLIIRLLKILVGGAVACVLLFAVCGRMAFAPIYSLRSEWSGHPERPHGRQDREFVGLWIREEPEEFSFGTNAFLLASDGELDGATGMTRRVWHSKGQVLMVDSWSGCGNCYSGTHTARYEAEFDGTNRMKLTPLQGATRQPSGWYERHEITAELKAKMEKDREARYTIASEQAYDVLSAIEQYEMRYGTGSTPHP